MFHDHTPRVKARKLLDIIKPRAALFDVPRFQRIVLGENSLARRAPLSSESDRCVPGVDLRIKRQLIRTRAILSRASVGSEIACTSL